MKANRYAAQMSESDSSGGGHPTRWKFLQHPLAAVVIGSVIGGASALGGSYLATTTQAQQDRAATVLQQREVRYGDFLNDSNTYAQSALAIVAHEQTGGDLSDPEGRRLLNAFRTARYNFRGDINDVFVYGTSDAQLAANRVVKTLPDTTGQERDFLFDTELYNHAYKGFLQLFRTEVQAAHLR